MENNETAIVQSCQNGNLDDFSQLYEKYIKKIYDFIYFRTHHKETAEDLTSLTFTKALQKIQSYRAGKGAFSSWLYRIARNTVIDHYRAQKTEMDIDDVWDLKANDNIERDLETKEKLEKIAGYLDLLDKQQRQVILMRVWDGLSYQEISQITKKSEASLKMMFSRAIKKLRQENALALIILLLINKIN